MKHLFVLAAVLFSCSTLFAQEEDLDAKYAADLLKPGTAAPSIIHVNKEGKQKDIIAARKGKYMLLEFWASWCGDCRREMKYLRRIQRMYDSDSIKVVGYSFDKEKEAWKKCRKDSALMWHQYMSDVPMQKSQVAKDYHLNWIPTFYLIDKDGNIMLSTVMMDKVFAKLKEIAPTVAEDKYPLESLEMPESKMKAKKDKDEKKDKANKKEIKDKKNKKKDKEKKNDVDGTTSATSNQ